MQNAEILDESSLTSGRRLIRNVVWNGAGEIGPLAAAFIAMPILIHALGVERFGILALAWTVFGYFSLLDIGVSYALTKLASDALATGREDEIPSLVGTALATAASFGIVGSIVLAAFAHLVVNQLFKVSADLHSETVHAMYVLALGIPVCVTIGALSGTLAAYQRFDLINFVRSPNAILTSVAPLCVLPFTHNIAPIIAVLFLVHALTWLVYFAMCRQVVPQLIRRIRFRRALVPALLGFGFWVASSNLVTMVMSSFDRFAIAAVVSMNALSYYIVPARILHKLSLVPWLISGVLFPAFAHSLASDRVRTRMLFYRGAKATALMMFPIVLMVVVFAHEIMTLWIGARFAAKSAPLVQLLAIAAMLEAIGNVAAALTSAAHRPDVNLKIHATELPIYLGFMFLMVYWRGAEGAAIACLVNAAVDATAHWIAARLLFPDVARGGRRLAYFTIAALCGLAIAMVPARLPAQAMIAAAEMAMFAGIAWLVLLEADDRASFRLFLKPKSVTALMRRNQAA